MDSSNTITLGIVLGEGASAVTFKALDDLGRTVCVKQYKTSVQVADRDRIQREIEVLKRLNHPQIPTVFGSYIDTVNGRDLLHVVQEFVDGEDLSSWSKSNRLEQSTVLEILIDTLGVLGHLHTAQPPILHRDIKPSNLMRRLDGRIVLIDFGQAVQDVHRTLGQTMVTGTIGYQAPEQIVGEATPKSDVYSVGVIAVELLTGTPAYKMLQGQTLRWERHCRRLPLSVQEWLDAVLHPEGNERYTSQQACAHLKELTDAFVSTAEEEGAHTTASMISSNFLELLDDAIHDESESKRKQREVEHRKRISQEREIDRRQQQEEEWKESESQLWSEMWSSWERLLDTIASGKVSREKGLEIFNRAFRERVEECERLRHWGDLHVDVVLLWNYTTSNTSLEVRRAYQRWIDIKFMHDKKEVQKTKRLRMVHLRREVAMIGQQLELQSSWQSWWQSMLTSTSLQQQQSEMKKELVQLGSELDALWREVERIIRRYVLFDFEVYVRRIEGQIEGHGTDTHEMVLIPKGEFMMGALETDEAAEDYEKPRHRVVLTRDFLMGKYAVTQVLWENVMGTNPSKFKGPNRPVEQVSWFDVVAFCNKLSEKEGLEPCYVITGERVECNWNAKGYRLPTEAEWEYSAAAQESYTYAGSNIIDDVAWYEDNSESKTHSVGQKKPNGFGLYDMSGNVWEWCWDWKGSYSGEDHTDPRGPSSGSVRVRRGGCWYFHDKYARISFRRRDPARRATNLGFRLMRLAP